MIVIALNAANLQKVSIENATDGVMSGSKYITYRRNSRFIYFGTKSMQGKKEVCRVMTLGFCVLVCLQFRAFFTGLRNACIFPHSGDVARCHPHPYIFGKGSFSQFRSFKPFV